MENTRKEILDINPNSKHISAILSQFIKNISSPSITIGEIKDTLSDRAFGTLMLLFALPNLIPLPIPGISTILGTPLIILSYQLMKGRKSPWFPKWLASRSLDSVKIKKILSYLIPYIIRLEFLLKPRLSFLIEPPLDKFIAGICFLMAIIMSLPMPLGNWFPAFTICLFALAILERDGVVVLLGLISALMSITLISTIVFAILKATLFFIEKLFE
jgi:hypothetical protein